jgi:hypothetical protein
VAISDRTRKLLWGRSGDRCAMCRKPLSRDPEHASDRVALVGEECHIVGRSPDGPRGGEHRVGDIDGYENLVLLCASDHAAADGHEASWTVERLRETKAAHERWVAARLSEQRVQPEMSWQMPGTRRTDIESIRSGSRLMGLYERALSASVRLPERLERAPRELAGALFRTAQEWSENWADVAFDQKLEIEAALDEALDELAAEGFMVLGGVQQKLLIVDGQESPWPEALIFVRSNAEIQAMLDAEEAKASESNHGSLGSTSSRGSRDVASG